MIRITGIKVAEDDAFEATFSDGQSFAVIRVLHDEMLRAPRLVWSAIMSEVQGALSSLDCIAKNRPMIGAVVRRKSDGLEMSISAIDRSEAKVRLSRTLRSESVSTDWVPWSECEYV